MVKTDVSVVDSILNMVMDIYTPPERDIQIVYIPVNRPDENISEAVRNFNPATHAIVSKEQLDITNQLKALGEIKDKVSEVHAVQFGKFYHPEKVKKPTKKEREKAELMALRSEAHLRMANRPERGNATKK